MTLALVHFNLSRLDGQATWPSMRTSGHTTNYGDVLVCEAILRQLKIAGGTRTIGYGGSASENSSQFLARGSTYLHNEFDFTKACATIESVKCEGTIVGLGAQSPTLDGSFLDANRGARWSSPGFVDS